MGATGSRAIDLSRLRLALVRRLLIEDGAAVENSSGMLGSGSSHSVLGVAVRLVELELEPQVIGEGGIYPVEDEAPLSCRPLPCRRMISFSVCLRVSLGQQQPIAKSWPLVPWMS